MFLVSFFNRCRECSGRMFTFARRTPGSIGYFDIIRTFY